MDVGIYIIASVGAGLLFGTMDAVINANPFARRLNKIYKPIMKKSVNPIAGLLIDLMYGFIMAGLFIMLYDSLPGDSGILRGVSYAGIVWFFRVFMSAATSWMTLKVPIKAIIYSLITGAVEMLVLGILFGAIL